MTSVQDTSAPRAGRRFVPTHELALRDDALAACSSLPGAHRGIYVVGEMTGPIGIPDFTVLVGNLRLLDARLALDVPPVLNQIDAAIVAATAVKSPRSSRTLALALGWRIETITRRISGLLRSGALIATRPDRYVRPEGLRPIGRLYAVEAKVNDRRAAIRQARAYGAWTDGYVLVMGDLSARSLRLLLQDVDSDRGGLVVGGQWLRKPTAGAADSVRQFWSTEHFVAAVQDDYQPSVAP